MADTERTRTAILALLADNVTGQISAQDLRDFVVSIMPPEYENVGDVWHEPDVEELGIAAEDQQARGWISYSQIMLSLCSYGDALFQHSDGTWGWALASHISRMPVAGLALGSYAIAESQAMILRRGIIAMTALSVRFAGQIGRPVYMQSTDSGRFSVTAPTTAGYSLAIGLVEANGVGSTITGGKMRFDPKWGVTGN